MKTLKGRSRRGRVMTESDMTQVITILAAGTATQINEIQPGTTVARPRMRVTTPRMIGPKERMIRSN